MDWNRGILSGCLWVLLSFGHVLADQPSQGEVLHVRRIVGLWQEGEQELARKEMRHFFQRHPASPLKSQLNLLIADEEYHQGHYREALRYYNQIPPAALDADAEARCLDCYYRCGDHEEIVRRLSPRISTSDIDQRSIYQYAQALAHLGRHEEAIAQFERLYNTSLESPAKMALVKSYVVLDQPEQAVDLLLAMAEDSDDQSDELLLQAALLQSQYDADAAAKTIGRIQGTGIESGAFCQALILFQAGDFRQLWDRRDHFLSSVDEGQKMQINLYLGRAALALGLWSEAEQLITPLAAGDKQDKIVLASLVACAQGRKQLEKAEAHLSRFETSFPDDPLLGRLVLAQAESYHQLSQPVAALNSVERVLELSKDPKEREKAALLRVVILCDQAHWRECHHRVEDFLAEYAASDQRVPLHKLLIKATIGQLEDTQLTADERELIQQRLVGEITALIGASADLTEDERISCLLQLASVQYARKNYVQARFYAKQLIEQHPKDQRLAQAHLLMAYCHYQENEWQPFIEHAETALALQPDSADGDKVRLNLFGVYLQLARAAGETSEGESGNIARAADHLYTVIQRGKTEVKPDNLRWLIGFYYANAVSGIDECAIQPLAPCKKRELAERALYLLTKLPSPAEFKDRWMSSQLLAIVGRGEDRRRELETILAYAWPNAPQLKRELVRARFALASVLESDGDTRGALKLYETFAPAERAQDPRIYDMAQLRLARLKYSQLSAPNDSQVQSVLQQLRDLQNRRTLAHEPIHLEAAYERAHIAAMMQSPDSPATLLVANLKQAKREITAEEDIVSRDYHTSRRADSAKNAIYQAYLSLFDARIAQLEAEIATAKRDFVEQRAKAAAARTLYTKLLTGEFAISKYLVSQAESNLDQMNANRTVNRIDSGHGETS